MRDTKGKEYAHSESRFANFDRGAERLGISRTMILNVYLHKHLDAIDSYVKTGQVHSEAIRGRIVDAITYLGLLAGILEEEASETAAVRPGPLYRSLYEVGETVVYTGKSDVYFNFGYHYPIIDIREYGLGYLFGLEAGTPAPIFVEPRFICKLDKAAAQAPAPVVKTYSSSSCCGGVGCNSCEPQGRG